MMQNGLNIPEHNDATKLLEDISSHYYDRDRDYGGLDLRYNSETSKTILTLVDYCAQSGFEANSVHVPRYTEMDMVLDGYMPADTIANLRKGKNPNTPVNVVVPMLYATRELFLTFLHRGYFGFDELHRYKGNGSPERSAKARIADLVISQVSSWFKERRALDIHWGDGITYGAGYMWGKWSKRTTPSITNVEVDELQSALLKSAGIDYEPFDNVRYLDNGRKIVKEGTEWIPLDPYQVHPDPNATADRFSEDSSFFGWTTRTSGTAMVAKEIDPEEHLFNCRVFEELARRGGGRSHNYRDVTARSHVMDQGQRDRDPRIIGDTTGDITFMFIRLVPSRYKFSDSDTPEWWFFAVGGDAVVLMAMKYEALHDGLPVVRTAPNARGHEVAPVSNLMITYGQQKITDFLLNQRTDFQDMVLNGKWAIDGRYIDYKSFLQGGGPMVLLMKKEGLGKPLNEVVQKFETQDTTNNNISDAFAFMQFAKEGNGIAESPTGLPDRAGMAGVAALTEGPTSRMARVAQIIDEQSRVPMAYQHLCNSAQWMGSEVVLDITGRQGEVIRRTFGLPEDATGLTVDEIDPDFGVVPMRSMSMQLKTPALMEEFAKTLIAQPGVLEEFAERLSPSDIVIEWLRSSGTIPDIDWMLQQGSTAQTMGDEEVLEQRQRGNLVPMSEGAAL